MSQAPKKQNFLQGATLLAIATVIVKVIGAVYKIPLQSVLGKIGYSYFSSAYDIYTLLLLISTAGLPVAMSRMISQASSLGDHAQTRKVYNTSRTIFLIIGAVSTGLMMVFCQALANSQKQPDAALAIFCLAPSAFFMSIISTYRGFFQGQGNMLPTSKSQVLEAVFKLGAGLAGAVLVLHLGCENLTHEQFVEELGQYDENRVKFLTCQQVEDEFEAGRTLLQELAAFAGSFQREEVAASELVIGMKCGGSDGLSGITANPTVGRFSDMLVAQGGSTVLTEVPEMFGAEGFLMDRCINEDVFHKAVDMINGFKNYFLRHNEVVYENPSPGNKAGGITTLEDKSCGCVQKGGSAPIMDVIGYGDAVTTKGLNMLYGPGNDLVSATALTAAGAHMVLFTTGRGTPFGAPAPTMKISTNTPLATKKAGWIDFNAGVVADGVRTLDEAGADLMNLVLEVASGKQTKTEERGFREISIFKDGVVL